MHVEADAYQRLRHQGARSSAELNRPGEELDDLVGLRIDFGLAVGSRRADGVETADRDQAGVVIVELVGLVALDPQGFRQLVGLLGRGGQALFGRFGAGLDAPLDGLDVALLDDDFAAEVWRPAPNIFRGNPRDCA